MRMPYWLLRLLPMWDYACSKCQCEVPKNSHRCPHCGERYPMPLKLPPSVLKNKESLEEYVHKHVFPKVSQAYRDYLAQFFTVLFSDGFESGDFSAWTGTNGSPTIVTDPVHHGSYAMSADCNGFADQAYKTISEISNFFARLYLRLTSLPTSGQYADFFSSFDGASDGLRVGIRNSGGNVQVYLNIGGETGVNYAFQADTWYCIDVEFDANDDSHHLWINDDLIVTHNSATSLSIDKIAVGNYYCSLNWTGDYIIDCVGVADEGPVGPEEEATLVEVADSLELAETTLRNKTLILFDSLGLADSLYGNKSLLLSDSASLSELVTVIIGEVMKYITDSVSCADLVSTPSRVLRTLEAIGAADNVAVNKVLQITEAVGLVEIVGVGVGGVKKTRLFLILGDLAVQLTGD
jgi:hypothetical protein